MNPIPLHNWMEKIGSRATRKVTPRPFLISAAWEPPKPIHFWKGHRKFGRNGEVKTFPHPLGMWCPMRLGRKNFEVWLAIDVYQILHVM